MRPSRPLNGSCDRNNQGRVSHLRIRNMPDLTRMAGTLFLRNVNLLFYRHPARGVKDIVGGEFHSGTLGARAQSSPTSLPTTQRSFWHKRLLVNPLVGITLTLMNIIGFFIVILINGAARASPSPWMFLTVWYRRSPVEGEFGF